MNGYIYLYKKIKEWQWSSDPNMLALFIHLLVDAAWKDSNWKGVDIKRGQTVIGRKALSIQTGISEQTIRTCLKRLKSTNEITIKSTNKYSIVTIINYDKYQSNEDLPTNKQPSNQQTINQQSTTSNKDNKDNIYNNIYKAGEKILGCVLTVNKRNDYYIKRFLKEYGSEEKILKLAKIAKSFDDTEYPYVIKSFSALYEKKEKILARHEQRLMREKNKQSKEMTFEGNPVIRKFNKLFVRRNGQDFEFTGDKKQIINYYE